MMSDEELLTEEIACSSDRSGVVLLGNKYFQFSANLTAFGDGIMFVKIVDADEWDRLRRSNRVYDYEHTKRLGFVEGHFYLYDNDCAHGDKEDAIVEFNGHCALYDFCDAYHPTLYIVVDNYYHTKFKVLKKSRYQRERLRRHKSNENNCR